MYVCGWMGGWEGGTVVTCEERGRKRGRWVGGTDGQYTIQCHLHNEDHRLENTFVTQMNNKCLVFNDQECNNYIYTIM